MVQPGGVAVKTPTEVYCMCADIAAKWEGRPERIGEVTAQVKTIHDKLLEWGWKDIDPETLDGVTMDFSRIVSYHECVQWLPFDVIGDWEDELFVLLHSEDEATWRAAADKQEDFHALAEKIRKEMAEAAKP